MCDCNICNVPNESFITAVLAIYCATQSLAHTTTLCKTD